MPASCSLAVCVLEEYLVFTKEMITCAVCCRFGVVFTECPSYVFILYFSGHHEFPPYTEQTKRSVYHVRNLEVFRLKQVQQTLFLNSVTFTLVDILFRFPAISTFSSLTTGLEAFTTLAMPTLCCDEKSISGRKLRMGRWAVLRFISN